MQLRGARASLPSPLLVGFLFALFAAASPAATWEWVYPRTGGNALVDLAYANGTYVAVGDAGTIQSSTDGRWWTPHPSGTRENIRAVTFGAGRWVAVGNAGLIASSADGRVWTLERSPVPNDISDIVFSEGRFFAIALAGPVGIASSAVLTSANGRDWDLRPLPAAATRIAAGAGRVMLAGSGTVLVTTNGGTVWTTVRQPNLGGFGIGIAEFANDRFWIGSEGTLHSSTDGLSWTSASVGQRGGFDSIAAGNGRLVVTGHNRWTIPGETASVFTSADGTAWTARPFSQTSSLTRTGDRLRSLVFAEGRFLAVGSAGLVAESTDGVTWTDVLANPRGQLHDITYGGGTWVAVGQRWLNDGNRKALVLSSTDGLNWTERETQVVGSWFNGVAYGNNRFVAVGHYGQAAVSFNGEDWIRVTTDGAWLFALKFFKGAFVATGVDGAVRRSTDGINWTNVPPPTTNNMATLSVVGDTLAATVWSEAPLRSSDGITWTRWTELPSDTRTLGGGNGVWLAAAFVPSSTRITGSVTGLGSQPTTGTVMFSRDGRSWEAVATPFTWGVAYHVWAERGRFFAAYDSGYVISSADTVRWEIEGRPSGQLIANHVEVDGTTYTVGGDSTILRRRETESAATSRFVNMSTRGRLGSGDRTMIQGFAVGGAAPRRLLVRAAGPALRAFGVSDAATTPQLEVYQGSTLLAANTGWGRGVLPAEIESVSRNVGAFPFAPDSGDSALLLTLGPGAYTAQIVSSETTPGVGLIEIYDTAPDSSGSALENISARGYVEAGRTLLVPGLVVRGDLPRLVLVRAVGPGLQQFGVTGALAQPVMSIYRGSRLVATNAGWRTAANADEIARAATRVAAFPLPATGRDAAFLVSRSLARRTPRATRWWKPTSCPELSVLILRRSCAANLALPIAAPRENRFGLRLTCPPPLIPRFSGARRSETASFSSTSATSAAFTAKAPPPSPRFPRSTSISSPAS